MNDIVWIVKCDGPRGEASTFSVTRDEMQEPYFWQDAGGWGNCHEFDTEAEARAYERKAQAYYDSVRPDPS